MKLDTTKTEAETHISIPTLEVRQNGNILYKNDKHAMLNRMLNVINMVIFRKNRPIAALYPDPYKKLLYRV